MKRLSKILVSLMFIGVGIILYSTSIEKQLLSIKNIKMSTESKDLKGIRIAYFTDTHYNGEKDNKIIDRLIEKINKLNTDIVIFTGDLVDSKYSGNNLEYLTSALSRIEARYGKYAVYGNHERNMGREVRYNKILKDSGFKLLVNEEKLIEVGDSKLSLIGLDDYLLGEYIDILPNNESDYSIVLSHEPDRANRLDSSKYDLQLSGHTHGGQVRLPFIGRLTTVKGGTFYDKGMYNISDRMSLFVSSGIGNSRLDIRAGNIPEIVIIELV